MSSEIEGATLGSRCEDASLWPMPNVIDRLAGPRAHRTDDLRAVTRITYTRHRPLRFGRSVSCGSGLGHLRDPSNTNAGMRELLAFCGQPGLTSHIWRRTVAAIMEPGGLSARAGVDQFGHRQVGTTMNHCWGKGIRSTGAAQVAGSLAFCQRVPDRP